MARIKTINGDYRFKQKNLVAGIKKIDKSIAKKNLLDVKKIFDKEGLYFGLIFGTLLGAIRENDFILHAADTDLFILNEDEEKFRSVLIKLHEIGFKLIRYERSGLYSISRNNEYIDIYTMRPFATGVRFCGAKYLLEKYLLDTVLFEFLGTHFIVPRKSKEFLQLHYGNDWETPIAYCDRKLTNIQISISKIKSIIKRKIPVMLYQKMLIKYHKNTYIQLLTRCKEMNINVL
jgi:lipopolysaccharide cholinephosphotransferase